MIQKKLRYIPFFRIRSIGAILVLPLQTIGMSWKLYKSHCIPVKQTGFPVWIKSKNPGQNICIRLARCNPSVKINICDELQDLSLFLPLSISLARGAVDPRSKLILAASPRRRPSWLKIELRARIHIKRLRLRWFPSDWTRCCSRCWWWESLPEFHPMVPNFIFFSALFIKKEIKTWRMLLQGGGCSKETCLFTHTAENSSFENE